MIAEALKGDYSKKTIFVIWLLVTIPMGLGTYVLVPWLIPHIPLHPGILYWIIMVIGMIWQFILSVIILKIELGTITWSRLKDRLWLHQPRDKNNNRFLKAYLLLIPIIGYNFFIEQTGYFDFITNTIVSHFPILAKPSYGEITALIDPQFRGHYSLILLAIVSCLFNYLLGEELLFRGILLPKMGKAFGKTDWIVNGILFATYHIHKITEVPLFIIGSFFIAFVSRKYRSIFPTLLNHGLEAVPLLGAVIWVVFFM
ncbi:CPBP family intramembrane glutamic endopeptidase [Spirochaeta cellobiosiphila]|uniref:CPBP family intramembrane glutamic endopeptidase n=1 Tax=Spirochaeta cellobiosiphila TaxID=504483 RepID=UPI0003FE22DA|nr:CPBP family intramembrane glutamic endopeptidase [Spirochaeta cellobiosiphila]